MTASLELEKRFWSKVRIGNECWEWTSSQHPSGYGTFYKDKKTQYAHRIAWTLEHGEIPEGLHILHSCDNPCCVRPGHLSIGTHQDNMRDRAERGRSYKGGIPPHHKGEKNGSAKLTKEDVLLIRSSKDSLGCLAKRFGVSKQSISNIKKKKTWIHVN